MSSFGPIALLLVLSPLACTEYVDAESALLGRLSSRFESNDYDQVTSDSRNPFESAGRKSAELFWKISKKLTPGKNPALKVSGRRSASMYQVASTTSPESFGLSNPDALSVIASEITGYFDSQSIPFSESNVQEVNSQLSSVSFSEIGVSTALSDARDHQIITPLQYDLIQLELTELLTASSREQAIAILVTFENALVNSSLGQDQTGWLLYLNSIVRNTTIQDQEPIAMGSNHHGFQRTAAVVPLLIDLVVYSLIGGAIGGLVGIIVCIRQGILQNFDCVIPWITTGMIIGGVIGIGPLYDEIFA